MKAKQAELQQLETDLLNAKLAVALRRADSDAALAKAALSAAQLRSNFRFGLTQVISSPSAGVVLTIGEDGRLSVLTGKMASGKAYFIADPAGPIIAAAISHSEKQLATATASGRIAGLGRLVRRSDLFVRLERPNQQPEFLLRRSGKLIVASRDGTLRLFDIKTGKMEDSRNAVFASRGCIPFTAQFLAYNPRPLYRASVGFEAQCVDGSQDAARFAERGLTPGQAALLAGPVADSAKSVEATLGPRNSTRQVPEPPPASTNNAPPAPPVASIQNGRGQERWRMNFSVWTRKNPTDSFGDPLATAQVEFDGGPNQSISSNAVSMKRRFAQSLARSSSLRIG